MEQHISAVVRSCFFHIRSLSKVRPYKAASYLILSKLDYYNHLLSGVPQKQIKHLQAGQNAAARPIMKCKNPRSHHLDSFTGFPSRNGSATKPSLPLIGQCMITSPSPSLIFSKNTTLLTFSDQHLDLSLRFPGPGIPRQSGTASEPSDMSLPPSGMSTLRASRTPVFQTFAENPSLPRDDNAIVYVCLRVSWCCHNYCVCDSFFCYYLQLCTYFLTAMYSSSFGKGWVGRSRL